MCSIFGVTSKAIPVETLKACFDRTVSRGPDMSRFEKIPIGYLGFHRLAIMGLDERGMQPFSLNGDRVVCNGELYGFRPLRDRLLSKYELQSQSDCEILLPLYHEYGVEMFKTLDAEFALILWDDAQQKLIASRDPIGIRPLYYGRLHNGAWAFASEPKNLLGLCDRILPFPPGHYWLDGQFIRYADPAYVGYFTMKTEEEVCAKLRRLLMDGVEKRLDADAPVGFLLSSGPASVCDPNAPHCDPAIYDLGVPVLGICYGMQLTSQLLGGQVEKAKEREYGRVTVRMKETIGLLDSMSASSSCWMSHTWQVSACPPGFRPLAETDYCPIAAMANEDRCIYGVQFHPEVTRTEEGKRLIRNFLYDIFSCVGDWTMNTYAETAVNQLRCNAKERFPQRLSRSVRVRGS